MIRVNGKRLSMKIFDNFRNDSISKNVWHDKNGRLSTWEYTFKSLGFTSVRTQVGGMGGIIELSDEEYVIFLLRFT